MSSRPTLAERLSLRPLRRTMFISVVSGSPITSNGMLAPQLIAQKANTVLSGPGSGSATTPTFRPLAPGDLPTIISSSTTGNAATATALGAVPAQCIGSSLAQGIAANGNANCIAGVAFEPN